LRIPAGAASRGLLNAIRDDHEPRSAIWSSEFMLRTRTVVLPTAVFPVR
jgi:hypothetical protein